MKKTVVLSILLVSVAAFVAYLVWETGPPAPKAQEPALPYPYHTEDITFKNSQAGITLSGTLTLPEKGSGFPAVVLISGSGGQNRDEEIAGHKPFLVIADHLTRQGIAVLRFDDRGVARSTGDFMAATTMDFATDAESAVAYLKTRKEINPEKIGLAGHSEGGLIAAIVASRSQDVSFIISLAGPGAPGAEVITYQAELMARAGGVSEPEIAELKKINLETAEMILNATDSAALKKELTAYVTAHSQQIPKQMIPPGQEREEFLRHQIIVMCMPWYQFLIKSNPATYFEKVTCPVLALNGAKDLQVDADQNLPPILQAVRRGGNNRVTVRSLPGLNHLFQECETGHPSEYATSEQTFSPMALHAMSDWIQAQFR